MSPILYVMQKYPTFCLHIITNIIMVFFRYLLLLLECNILQWPKLSDPIKIIGNLRVEILTIKVGFKNLFMNK